MADNNEVEQESTGRLRELLNMVAEDGSIKGAAAPSASPEAAPRPVPEEGVAIEEPATEGSRLEDLFSQVSDDGTIEGVEPSSAALRSRELIGQAEEQEASFASQRTVRPGSLRGLFDRPESPPNALQDIRNTLGMVDVPGPDSIMSAEDKAAWDDFIKRFALDLGVTAGASIITGGIGGLLSLARHTPLVVNGLKGLEKLSLAKKILTQGTALAKNRSAVLVGRAAGQVATMGGKGSIARNALLGATGAGGSSILMGDDWIEVRRQAVFGGALSGGMDALVKTVPAVRWLGNETLAAFRDKKALVEDAAKNVKKAISPTLINTNVFKNTIEPQIQASFVLENNIWVGAKTFEDVSDNAVKLIGGENRVTGKHITGELGVEIGAAVNQIDEELGEFAYKNMGEVTELEGIFKAGTEEIPTGQLELMERDLLDELPEKLVDDAAEKVIPDAAEAIKEPGGGNFFNEQALKTPTEDHLAVSQQIDEQLAIWKKGIAAENLGFTGRNLPAQIDKEIAESKSRLLNIQAALDKKAQGQLSTITDVHKRKFNLDTSGGVKELELEQAALHARLQELQEAVANPKVRFGDVWKLKSQSADIAFRKSKKNLEQTPNTVAARNAAKLLGGAARRQLELEAAQAGKIGQAYIDTNAEYSVIATIADFIEKGRNQELVRKEGAFSTVGALANIGRRIATRSVGIDRAPRQNFLQNTVASAEKAAMADQSRKLRGLTNIAAKLATSALGVSAGAASFARDPEEQLKVKTKLLTSLLIRTGQITEDELMSGAKAFGDIDPELLAQAIQTAESQVAELASSVLINGASAPETKMLSTMMARQHPDIFPEPKSGIPGEIPVKEGRILFPAELRARYSKILKDKMSMRKLTKSQAARMISSVQNTGLVINAPKAKNNARIKPRRDEVTEADL